jgi:DNA-binding PadR family transcriptional regulator
MSMQGTLDLLILRTLALEPMHGWGIAQRIQQVSKDALQIGQGSLYPALHRLDYKGVDTGRVRSLGKQPQGEILFANQDWAKATAS